MEFIGIVGLISVLCGAAVLLDGKRRWTGSGLCVLGFALLFVFAANA